MAKVYGRDSDVHFGGIDEPLPDWRAVKIPNDEDPDDEELDKTPPEVKAILGFDPKE